MSNAYDSTRGNVTDRQRRKQWLLDTYRADVDVLPYQHPLSDGTVEVRWEAVCLDVGVKACRCYRCGCLLRLETLTVDRIRPGFQGGTYRRDNIRPSCSDCANKQGAGIRNANRASD